MKERNQSIDIIKIIAMMMVLLLHTGVARDQSIVKYTTVPEIYLLAGIAIPLFFMVSGYLLVNKFATTKYCISKILGILRFTLIVCIIWHLMLLVTGKTSVNDSVQIFTADYLGGFLQYGFFAHFWYFGAMFVIYMLLPILIKIIHSKYFPYIIAATFILSTIACVLDVYSFFEKNYIRQTFRLWYWLLYFTLGAFVNIHEKQLPKCKWWCIIISGLVFVVFGKYVNGGGNEYLYGSIPCIAYAVSLFIFCVKARIHNNKIISSLSKCFLPVYATHMIILGMLFKHNPMIIIENNFIPEVAIAIQYGIAVVVTLSLSFILMCIPYMDKIFRI